MKVANMLLDATLGLPPVVGNWSPLAGISGSRSIEPSCSLSELSELSDPVPLEDADIRNEYHRSFHTTRPHLPKLCSMSVFTHKSTKQ